MSNNNKIYKEVNCDTFIVPNNASKISGYMWGQENLTKRTNEIYNLNGIEFNPAEDHMLQLWMTNDQCENLNDHTFYIFDDVYHYTFRLDSTLPAILFKDKKEGDVVDVVVTLKPISRIKVIGTDNISRKDSERIWYDDKNSPEAPVFEITFNLKLNQSNYRYRRFGKFEDVYNMVCR